MQQYYIFPPSDWPATGPYQQHSKSMCRRRSMCRMRMSPRPLRSSRGHAAQLGTRSYLTSHLSTHHSNVSSIDAIYSSSSPHDFASILSLELLLRSYHIPPTRSEPQEERSTGSCVVPYLAAQATKTNVSRALLNTPPSSHRYLTPSSSRRPTEHPPYYLPHHPLRIDLLLSQCTRQSWSLQSPNLPKHYPAIAHHTLTQSASLTQASKPRRQ
jgi:hypothetical protein